MFISTPIYAKLQNVIQVYLHLTKLCHIKRNHPVNFHFSLDWLGANCTDFTTKDEWPQNSRNLSPLAYHVWGAMLSHFTNFTQSPIQFRSQKVHCSRSGMTCLPQTTINKVKNFRKRLNACASAGGGHFEYTLCRKTFTELCCFRNCNKLIDIYYSF